nr:hypothetical protein Q903MT_gene2542 [Picea sitchensis]
MSCGDTLEAITGVRRLHLQSMATADNQCRSRWQIPPSQSRCLLPVVPIQQSTNSIDPSQCGTRTRTYPISYLAGGVAVRPHCVDSLHYTISTRH